MPHIVLEYSAEIQSSHDIDTLCEVVFHWAETSGVFPDASAIKVRAIPYTHAKIGTDNQAFLHANISLLDGRSLETKSELTTTLLARLAETLTDVGSLSVDIHDIVRATYAKRTL
ncbi:5-carboxymethyl-2-hydroxymuconate Delta-isomerase [Cochlodiniinecator piscidefendens]|uniref:5-carboxymethyl-2-hydroxymuconate Delta-isomerase n=1 Tax=Cochlodiniinecator piscidefendens TaxID=2715756 RepID=UPI00140D3F7A|nr:5-carboxymethyl-2-hydroxymuconate Delta-isomerase [Cochlodiniinecator piscidefendens]